MDAWQVVRDCIDAQDRARLIKAVSALSEDERREVGAWLPGYLKEKRAEGERARRWLWRGAAVWRIAGAACLSGAAQVAAWLNRRDLPEEFPRGKGNEHTVLTRVLLARPEKWRRDLAVRLVSGLRLPRGGRGAVAGWDLAVALVRATGVEPPENDAFVAEWVLRLGDRHGFKSGVAQGQAGGQESFERFAVERALRDPLLDHMVERLFRADGVAAGLEEQIWGAETGSSISILTALSAIGRLKRQALLDGCVGRMLGGGERSEVEPFGRLWEALEPSTAEIPARDLVRLLPASPVSVAEIAVTALRRLDDERSLDDDFFAEAVAALAFRPERKLVGLALTWVGHAVRMAPRRADAGLAAVAAVLGHEMINVQERAVKLAVRLAKIAGESGRAAIREAAPMVPGEMRARLAAAYGDIPVETGRETALESVAVPAPVLMVTAPPALGPPLGSPDEVVRELTSLSWDSTWSTMERVLAGLVEWTHRDRPAMCEALRPWRATAWPEPVAGYPYSDYTLIGLDEGWHSLLRRLALAIVSPADSAHVTATVPDVRLRRSERLPFDVFGDRRVRELVLLVESGGTMPLLLATPTSGTGHIDPDTLVARMRALEAAGADPLEADFHQALLRLPRSIAPAALTRASALTSPRGRELASWLAAGGIPDPEVRCLIKQHNNSWHRGIRSRVVSPEAALPDPIRQVLTFHSSDESGIPIQSVYSWPAMAPSHREVVAAYPAQFLTAFTDYSDPHTAVLLSLAQTDGPVGQAMATALVAGMGHARHEERAWAVEALVTLVARDQAPTREIAEAVVTLVEADFVKLNRVAAALDAAIDGGAAVVVWEILAEVLTRFLPQPGTKPRTALSDLLAVATRAVTQTGPSTAPAPPALATAAGRPATSRFAQEARRLHHTLAGFAVE
ncbi:DUF7824 domain-containing protein [Sinosporangium siamense]|uniref:DUF7824 domain-containing protein n=1 Tax=Sinosporangium siamense TaxID=1367973 RepID=A0A919RFL7_9ACTN|nr:DUF6493 family protein [Sinosporangium siamense]GII91514.1 hypothetical protein Ssi02_17450 [Sinosporangium siamense]